MNNPKKKIAPASPVKSVDKPKPKPAEPKGSKLQSLKRRLVREEIVKSAACLFADRGVRNVTLDEVAKGLGYTKSSVYYYFTSKDELLWAVFNYISGHFVGNAERISENVAEPVTRLKELLRMHVRFLAEHREWATVFYRDVQALSEERQKEVHDIMVKYDAIFRQAIQDGAQTGEMQSLAPDVVTNALLGACNWMVNWILPKHQQNIGDIAETFVSLFIDGLATRPADK